MLKPTARENALVQCHRWGMLTLAALWHKLGPLRNQVVFDLVGMRPPQRHILIRTVEGLSETLGEWNERPPMVPADLRGFHRGQAYDPVEGWIFIYQALDSASASEE